MMSSTSFLREVWMKIKNVFENIVDSYNTSPEEDELSPVGPSASPKAGEKSKAMGKKKLTVDAPGEGLIPIYMFPSARELKDATDCYWTRELISALHKARASYDAIREREIKKDKAYAEIEKKCNKALQDLDKNPLVSDMRV
ncbi:hypothetical protein Tco_0362819 [Tanacetum coccineum]